MLIFPKWHCSSRALVVGVIAVLVGELIGGPGCSKPRDGMTASGGAASRQAAGPASQVPAGDERPKTGTAGETLQGESLPIAVPLRDVNADELTSQLRAANPGFQGKAIMERQGGDVVVAINDPAVKDITPLAGLRIHKLDLYECGVGDLSPLRGLPLTALAIDRTQVGDLSPLQGMPLEYLSASETSVQDLTPLRGCPLRQLNLVRTKVRDLSPLSGCPLQSLWLNDAPVHDVSPLAQTPLESLTLAGTAVEDLQPLKGVPLKRLHIARTPVKDLTPLRWLMLERLVFTPSRIGTGLDVVRGMTSLREIGTAFGESDWGIEDRLYAPPEFWELWDQGKLVE